MKYLLFSLLSLCATIQILSAQTDTTATADDELLRWLERYGTPISAAKPDSANTDTIKKIDNAPIETPDSVGNLDSVVNPKTIDTIENKEKQEEQDTLGKATTSNPQDIDSIISDAFSKSVEKQKREALKPKSGIATTTPSIEKSSSKTKSRKPRKTPRPILPDIPAEPEQLITAEDSLITHYEALAAAGQNPLFLDWVACKKPFRTLSFTSADSTIIHLRNEAVKSIRTTRPELFDYHYSQLPSKSEIKSKRMETTDTKDLVLRSDLLNIRQDNTINIKGYQKPRWTAGAKFQIQASQNYISKNWYKGGESNLAVNLYAMGYCNYDNRKGLQWNNKLEWKLGANSTGSDSLRMIGVNDDLLRLNSKLGLKAFKSFYYTAEYDIQTTLFNSYRPQTYVRSSGPLSPIRMNLSLGMDYKFKEKLSVFLSPVSYKLVFVTDTTHHPSVGATETIPYIIGITDGSRSINQLGALVRIGWEHKFTDNIEMEVKFSFFGNYVGAKKGIETDLEVIGNFQINRFLSAKVSLNPRYDSTVAPAHGGKPKLQFRELISVGFNYVL